jgi:putative acetyltransferase
VLKVARDLLIRNARREDWKLIYLIRRRDSVFRFLGGARAPSAEQVRNQWFARLAEPRVRTMVALSEGKAVGYVRLKRGESLGSHSGEISAIAVHPDFHGKGIGRRLMEEALDVARGLGLRRTWLTVTEDNYVAIHLYVRMGFEVEGREREAVRRRRKYIDLLVMGRLERKRN